jgi:CubicO group peptidase (beta-lactamase class C family)
VSTVEDLVRFVRALDSGVLLRPETVRRMTEDALRLPGAPPWGLGVEAGGEGARAEWGHHGGSPGVSARLIVLRGRRATIVVLSNYDTAATIVGDGIRDLLVAQ